MMDMGTLRTKVTSKVTHSIRLAEFSFQHSARLALRPFGIAPNDVQHSARSTSFSAFRRSAFRHGAILTTVVCNDAMVMNDRCEYSTSLSGISTDWDITLLADDPNQPDG